MPQVIPLGPAARMLTTREAALRLGVSLRTVQLWVEADILPAARTPGGHRRIPHNAVEALAMSMGLGDAVQGQAPPPLAAVGAVPRHRPWRIVLVSQDRAWLEGSARALEVFGHSVAVETADNGYVALLQIGRQTPHLLITALDLPGMDGVEMLRTLQRSESFGGLDVLALSARADLPALPPSVEVLADTITPEALAIRVGRWLLARQSMMELQRD